ncbi:MAG: hypothetical protein PHI32_10395 [Dysgonamonadaceae bacterium]|nr:hypothetical protein [Dysgonamonadaceae bacterium]
MHNFLTVLSRSGLKAKLCFLFVLFYSSLGFAQPIQFSEDSIPIIGDEVVFSVKFEHDLTQEEFRNKSYYFLNDKLNPYSGGFLVNNEKSTVSKITDYLEIDSNPIYVNAMYMTYKLHLTYVDGLCSMLINDITYMEKEYFEAQEKSDRKLYMPEYSGKDIMIDKKYTKMLSRNISGKTTAVTLKRINEIIKSLDSIFTLETTEN